jgi:hypothetical protein
MVSLLFFQDKILRNISDIILVMLKRRLLIISFFTILLVAIFHFMALKYSWYWSFRWIDIPVHIVGGFWVSLTVLWIALKVGHIEKITNYKKRALVLMIGSAFIVGILWEVFEVVFKINFLHNVGYWRDSLKDILDDFLGGGLAYLYFIKSKKSKNCLIVKPESHLMVPLVTKNN